MTPGCGSGGFVVVIRAPGGPRPRGGVWSRIGLYIPILYHVVVPRCGLWRGGGGCRLERQSHVVQGMQNSKA